MQPMPHLHEERALVTKWHVIPLAIVDLAQVSQSILDFRWTVLTSHDVAVDDIQRLGGIGHGLDAAGEKATGAVNAVAMTTGNSGKAHLEFAASTETIGFGEDARLHLAQELECERGGAAPVGGQDQWWCLGSAADIPLINNNFATALAATATAGLHIPVR